MPVLDEVTHEEPCCADWRDARAALPHYLERHTVLLLSPVEGHILLAREKIEDRHPSDIDIDIDIDADGFGDFINRHPIEASLEEQSSSGVQFA